ncbi:MAG: hypothetical protein WA705_22105 [Candidatus Ozemobacteraceae bacterium]
MENKEGVLLGLVLGLVIGQNWTAIRKWLRVALDASATATQEAMRQGAEIKERIDDARAEAEYTRSTSNTD